MASSLARRDLQVKPTYTSITRPIDVNNGAVLISRYTNPVS